MQQRNWHLNPKNNEIGFQQNQQIAWPFNTVQYLHFHMEVSWNGGTPKSSILIGCSIINYKPSILGYPHWWKPLYLQLPLFRQDAESGMYVSNIPVRPEHGIILMAVSTIRILVYDEYMKYTAYWSSKKYSAEWYIMVILQKKSAAMVSLLFKIPGFSNLHNLRGSRHPSAWPERSQSAPFLRCCSRLLWCGPASDPPSQEGLGKTPQTQKES